MKNLIKVSYINSFKKFSNEYNKIFEKYEVVNVENEINVENSGNLKLCK